MNRVILGPEYFPSPDIGRPISGAQIFVGIVDLDPEVAGNQKQISVLQEDTTTVQVSQPVLTGAGGVPVHLGSPVTILVDGEYSLKVLDKNDAQVYYVPSSVATDADASNVSYNQGGTGAVDRTVEGKLQEIVSVLDFGAVGDGVVDDTAAIQAAIDYLATIVVPFNRGVMLTFPVGEYLLTSTITVNVPQLHIKGDGFGTMFARATDYGTAFLVQTDTPDDSKLKQVQFSNFYVLSSAADTTGSIFACNNCSQLTFTEILIQDCFRGVTLAGCDNVWFNHVDITSGQRYSSLQAGSSLLRLEPYITAALARIQNASIYLNTVQLRQDTAVAYIEDGLHILSVDGLYCTGSHLGFAKSIITAEPFDAEATIQFVMFSSCYIDGNVEMSEYCVRFDPGTDLPHTGAYANILFANCVFVRPELSAVLIDSDTVDRCSFSNCSFVGGNEDGILVKSDATNFIFTGCNFALWNRDNAGSAWDVRFLAGNAASEFIFNGCSFNSANVDENMAFGGSEDNIIIQNCIFSKTSLGGTTTGKTIILNDQIGLTEDMSSNFGSSSVSPDGNGNGTIAHGLSDTPTFSDANIIGDTPNGVDVQSVGSTNLIVRIHDAAGADVTSGSFTVQWEAKV